MFPESAIHGSNTIQLVLSCTALFDNRSFVLESWLALSDTRGKERNLGLALNIFQALHAHGIFTLAVEKIDAVQRVVLIFLYLGFNFRGSEGLKKNQSLMPNCYASI